MEKYFCKYVFENLGSLILHFSQNLSQTAMIWHWEAPFNLEVNDNMRETKHNLGERIPQGWGCW